MVNFSHLCECASGIGAGESAIETLLDVDPDPDHVTHAHAGDPPMVEEEEDSSSPSIDSNKENSLEMVNLLHPNTPGKASSGHAFKEDLSERVEEASIIRQEDEEAQQLISDHEEQKPAKVCAHAMQGLARVCALFDVARIHALHNIAWHC